MERGGGKRRWVRTRESDVEYTFAYRLYGAPKTNSSVAILNRDPDQRVPTLTRSTTLTRPRRRYRHLTAANALDLKAFRRERRNLSRGSRDHLRPSLDSPPDSPPQLPSPHDDLARERDPNEPKRGLSRRDRTDPTRASRPDLWTTGGRGRNSTTKRAIRPSYLSVFPTSTSRTGTRGKRGEVVTPWRRLIYPRVREVDPSWRRDQRSR
jgi:hypothetical protein